MQYPPSHSFSPAHLGIPHFIKLLDKLVYAFPHPISDDSVRIK